MCFIFTCGEQEFTKQLEGAEGLQCQCRNCGNWSATVVKHHPWFTFCFVPVIPLSIHGYEDVVCSICNFSQPLANRGDIIQQMRLMQQNRGEMPLQIPGGPPGQPPGWGGSQPVGTQVGPKPSQSQMAYG